MEVVANIDSLNIVVEFQDLDTRSITLNNPITGLTAAQIKAIESLAANVLIGDKQGSPFSRIKSACQIKNKTTYITDTLNA